MASTPRTTTKTKSTTMTTYAARDLSTNEHRVSGFCCYRVTSHPAYETEPFVYSGPNVLDVFYDHAMREAQLINAIVADDQDMMPMTSTNVDNTRRPLTVATVGLHLLIKITKSDITTTSLASIYLHVATIAICN